jgi:hypothetical protein
LIDVSRAARQAGIVFPVALTRAAWECVVVPAGVLCQDEAGRIWDVVWMLRYAIKRGTEVRFGVHVRSDNRERTTPLVRLEAVCGPDVDGSACITVMLPDED